MRILAPLLLALVALTACDGDQPSLDFIDVAVHDSAHFELHTPQGREAAAIRARFVWRAPDGGLVLDRVVELTPDSAGYHRVISPEGVPDLVVRAVPAGAEDVEVELTSVTWEDGGSWGSGG